MTLFSFLIALVPYCYIAWRLTNALGMTFPQYAKLIRLVILLIFISLNLFPLLSLLSYLSGATRNLFIYNQGLTIGDYFVHFPYWFGIILMIEIFPYFLATDVIQILIKLFFKNIYGIWSQWLYWIKIGIFVFFAVYVALRIYVDTYSIRTNSYTLNIKQLPQSLNNLSILLIADLQVDRYTQKEKLDKFETLLGQNQSDILLFAGDLITSGTRYIQQGLDVLCRVQSNSTRIACVGDHDFWADAARIGNGFKNCGWIFLDNEHHIVPYNKANILITGITYIYSKRISVKELDRLLGNAPEADLKILLVHQPAPTVLRAAEAYGYHMVFAGHTHGGQVVVKPFGFNLTPTQFENKIYSGLGKLNDLNIFVTNGIGLTLMPLRYQAPAEIMRINIRKE
jgi:predicted MPP superfamily phosphohydrolase